MNPDRRYFSWMWLAAALLMLAEFVLFDRMTAWQHAWIHPRWNDQVQYLTESYNAYETLRTQGWWAGLLQAWTNPAPQGTLHDIAAVFVFGLFGPSRLAALDLNFAAFLLWQAATLFAIHRLTRSAALGWLGFGLLLCLAGPWAAGPGSAIDFRLDHAAMCLWGVTACTALLTRGFRDLGWSLAFGGLAGLTIIERFLTGAYFAPLFLAFAVWIFCGGEKSRRLRNLAGAGAIAFALAAPFFWTSRASIYAYYWGGHLASAESDARAPHLAAWDSLAYVFGGLGRQQLGAFFGLVALGVSFVPLLVESFWDRRRSIRPKSDRDWLFTALACFILPAALLCLHRQKSIYVLGVLAPGLVLLLLWLWHRLFADLPLFARRPGPPLLAAIAAVAVGAGLGFFTVRQVTPAHSESFITDTRKVRALTEQIYQTVKRNNLRKPQLGMDRVNDAIAGVMFRITCYEKHHEWIAFGDRLPTGVLAVDDEVIFSRLAACDFMFLTDELAGPGNWPYDQQMKRLYPQLKAWCEEHMERLDSFPLGFGQMSLYQRRGLIAPARP